MKKTSALTISVIALIASVNCASSLRADCGGQLSVTITNLPEIDLAGFQVSAISSNGELTGFFYVSFDHPAHIFSYNNGQLIDLGTLGGDTGQGNAINSSGQIAGESEPAGSVTPHAFIYDGTNLKDLGTLGGSSSRATLLNDLGQAAGTSLTDGDVATHAFLYANSLMSDLGTLNGTYSSALAVNNSGQVAGQSTDANNELHAFLYSGGPLQDLGTLGGQYSAAYGINDSGMVIGESSIDDSTIHPFLFANNTMTDLQGLGGSYASAFSINNAGQVLGLSSLTNESIYHGFVFVNGTLTDLGTLGGDNTTPSAQNNRGQVVGQSDTVADGSHAFIWQNGAMTDLNTLLPTNSDWQLQVATLINDSGRIVGVGIHNGISEWFILDLASGDNPPIAVAGPDQLVDCQTAVTLDGSHSSDPDGDPLTFEWTCAGYVLGTNSILTGTFAPGTNVVTLKVSDPCGETSSAVVTVTVVDTNAPVVLAPNQLTLVADANCQAVLPSLWSRVSVSDNCTPNQSLVLLQTPPAGTALGVGHYSVIVSATDLSGNSGTAAILVTVADTAAPVITSAPQFVRVCVDSSCQGTVPDLTAKVTATDACTGPDALVKAQTPAAGTVVTKGDYTVTVTVTDASGNAVSQQIPISVVDATPPIIASVSASPNVLSPPNHQMIPVTVYVDASDNCDVPVSKIISITCSETVSPSEMRITGDLTAMLAATRNGGGSGRIYTITVQSSDSSDNVSTATTTVIAPQGNK